MEKTFCESEAKETVLMELKVMLLIDCGIGVNKVSATVRSEVVGQNLLLDGEKRGL